MSSQWQPYRESPRTTLTRTVAIAAILGVVLSWRAGLSRWPTATLLALWPALGGHFVELFFLNWLRPRIPAAKAVQAMARIVVWFVGGLALTLAMHLTATALSLPGPARWPWWLGGIGFIGIELMVHLVLLVGGRPSFYNGRG